MKQTLSLLVVFAMVGMFFSILPSAHAQPLEEINTDIVNYDGQRASVNISWNHDKSVKHYELGCVSCSPNSKLVTVENNFVMDDVSPFPDTSKALLYLIALDFNDEIINAKQIIVDLNLE